MSPRWLCTALSRRGDAMPGWKSPDRPFTSGDRRRLSVGFARSLVPLAPCLALLRHPSGRGGGTRDARVLAPTASPQAAATGFPPSSDQEIAGQRTNSGYFGSWPYCLLRPSGLPYRKPLGHGRPSQVRACPGTAPCCRIRPLFRSRRRRCAAPLARRQRRALPWEARAAHAGPSPTWLTLMDFRLAQYADLRIYFSS